MWNRISTKNMSTWFENTKQIAGNMNASVASQKTRRKLHKKVFERIKESTWGTSMWVYMDHTTLKHNLYSLWISQNFVSSC